MSEPETLPDCRAREPKRAIPTAAFGYMVPVTCGSCAKTGPVVPAENMTFAFWLCKDCEKYGEIAGTMMIPDEVFWEKVKQEQIEKYGRLLEPHEIEAVAAADSSPLATLIKRGR